MNYFVKTRHEDGQFTIGTIDNPKRLIGFWCFKPEDEAHLDQMLKGMNGAFEDGIRYAQKHIADMHVSDFHWKHGD